MSNQTDFSWIGSLIVLAAGLTYNALYEFSTVLGITWIDVDLSTRPPFDKPDPEYGGILVVIIIICIISALNYIYKKIDLDLENGVISEAK